MTAEERKSPSFPCLPDLTARLVCLVQAVMFQTGSGVRADTSERKRMVAIHYTPKLRKPDGNLSAVGLTESPE